MFDDRLNLPRDFFGSSKITQIADSHSGFFLSAPVWVVLAFFIDDSF